jgi:DNA-binding transcriptional LysR family regulator
MKQSEQPAMNLRSVDLNLLTIFDAIMMERNMTRAADHVGMTQPAMSNALGRLRALTGDPLFVRTAKGMTPTARANALAAPVRQALDLVRTGLSEAALFDPKTSDRSFTLAMGDYCEVAYLPRVLAALRVEAPNVHLSMIAQAGATLRKELKEGSVDLVWDATAIDSTGFQSEKLIDDSIVWIMNENHPLAKKRKPSIKDYQSASHIRLEPGYTYVHDFDQYVRQLGIHRSFDVEVARIVPMVFMVAETDHVATMPRRMAEKFSDLLSLVLKPLPFDIPSSPLYQSWHTSKLEDPGHMWLRNRLLQLMSEE